jgi:hypothetical protein
MPQTSVSCCATRTRCWSTSSWRKVLSRRVCTLIYTSLTRIPRRHRCASGTASQNRQPASRPNPCAAKLGAAAANPTGHLEQTSCSQIGFGYCAETGARDACVAVASADAASPLGNVTQAPADSLFAFGIANWDSVLRHSEPRVPRWIRTSERPRPAVDATRDRDEDNTHSTPCPDPWLARTAADAGSRAPTSG